MNALRRVAIWQWLLIISLGLSLVYYLYVVPAGDDLGYARVVGGAEPYSVPWWKYGVWCVRHWLHVNGRWGNYILPLVVESPQWLRALLGAAGAVGMCLLAVICARLKRGWLPVALIAAIWLLMPWWDSFFLYACNVNYVWPSVFMLGTVLLITRNDASKDYTPWWMYAVAFIGGCGHEAGALPLVIGYIGYMWLNRRIPEGGERRLALCFCFGLAFTLCSPALWSRFLTATGGGIPDDTPLWLFLKSDAIAGVLWIMMTVCGCTSAGRYSLTVMLRSRAGIFALATLPAAAISVVSGVVGRSGWYAELFALISLAAWCGERLTRPRRGLGLLIAAVTVLQLGTVAWWQRLLGMEHRQFIGIYLCSPDGMADMQPIPDDAQPLLTLWRARGVPDGDDVYLLENLRLYLRGEAAPWPVLKGEVYDTMPAGTRLLTDEYHEVYVTERDGIEYTVTPAADRWHLNRRVIDPGDRY
ncbi:MAG: hypothetical protein K2N96_05695 [Muribaculaceae bacterium]|nr:hypothetical protein [Muribaculaceae bacterium]